jgi:RND family efflux transporter MFP subunit
MRQVQADIGQDEAHAMRAVVDLRGAKERLLPRILSQSPTIMPLDKAALESLRMDRSDAAEARYRDRGSWNARRWVLAGLALAVLAALAYRFANAPTPVKTAIVELPAGASDGAVLNASGYVVARRLATVSSLVTGRIIEADFEEGASVERGQVLARLDPATTQAEFDLTRSGVEAARRGTREIEVRLVDAQRTLARNRELAERKLVAQSLVDTSGAEVDALRARLEVARAELAVAEARERVARQSLEDLVIRAPFAGVVISKDAQPGEMISPISAGGGFTRTGIATLVDMDSREIEVDVNEAYINRVRPRQKVTATLDAYPDWKVPGSVIGIVPTADRQKATVRVRIAFDALDPRILPDMGIKVGFLEEGAAAVAAARPTLPETALLREGDTTQVWLVRDGRVERRAVRVGEGVDGRVPVDEGIAGGDVVVVDPPKRLREGAAVSLEGG